MSSLKDVGWDEYRRHLWREARKEGVPISGTFELTPLCNYKCRMCFVRLDRDEMMHLGRLYSAEEWIDLARQASQEGMYRVTLTGGEVLTRQDFPEIYSGLFSQGLFITVLSNASLVDDEIVQLFSMCPPVGLRFTLYGTSNETYERLCGVQRGYDRTIASLIKLKEAGVPFTLAFTETTENISDLDEAFEVADKLGTSLSVATGIVSPMRGASSKGAEIRVPLESRPDYLRPASGVMDEERWSQDDLLLGSSPAFAGCKSYRTGFWVDWNGDMEVCGFMSWCKCRPFENGFRSAWNEMLNKLDRILVPEACSSCTVRQYCTACPGVRFSETGSPEGICDRFCADAEAWRAKFDSELFQGGLFL